MNTASRRKPGPPPRLPSVEVQTVAFVEAARARGWPIVSEWVRWDGFKVYLRYIREHSIGEEAVGEILVIASVTVPERFQRRGWFWRYCQMCLALVEDGLAIECVYNPWLHAALARRSPFREWQPNQFVLLKSGPRDWPLKLIVPSTERYPR